jgi:EpsI family protein
VNPVRLTMLSALLVVTALLVHCYHWKNLDKSEKEPLQQVFAKIGGWRLARHSPMDVSIVEELKLDDYLFQSYGRDKGLVTLYIGYYKSAKKVGAAHDPQVCFLGQGWQISNSKSGEYLIPSVPALRISYSSMIAELQGERLLIVYWFQANRKATASTRSQKVAMFLDKLSGRSEDNAFVRITAPIGEEAPETVRKRLFDFIDDFYPCFYRYVTRT